MPTIAAIDMASATSVAENPTLRVKNRALVVMTAPAPNRFANEPRARTRRSSSTGMPRRVSA